MEFEGIYSPRLNKKCLLNARWKIRDFEDNSIFVYDFRKYRWCCACKMQMICLLLTLYTIWNSILSCHNIPSIKKIRSQLCYIRIFYSMIIEQRAGHFKLHRLFNAIRNNNSVQITRGYWYIQLITHGRSQSYCSLWNKISWREFQGSNSDQRKHGV